MPEQLIWSFDMQLSTPDCFPGVDWYRAVVHLPAEITEVLPYLNAEFKGADYNHAAKILLCMSNDKKYAFRPCEIVIAPVENREEAERLINDMIGIVNDIWIRRNEIKPNYEGKKPPPPVLAIYQILPKTNCRECGFTCMAFANALRRDLTKLSLCPYLAEEDYNKLLA